MTDADYGTFERAFRRLSGAFRLKVKPEQMDELIRSYFKVLESASIEDVMAAGKVCISRCRRFPLPVEWLEALPAGPVGKAEAADVRVMSVDESTAYVRAERLRYGDVPCECLACQAAGVDTKPLRFVPDVLDGHDERAMCPAKNAIVTVGHWAHGDELARWYAMRDAFYALYTRAFPKKTRLGFTYVPPPHAPSRPELVSVGREPGEEG